MLREKMRENFIIIFIFLAKYENFLNRTLRIFSHYYT